MNKQKGFTVTELLIVLIFLSAIGMFIGSVWVIIHFFLKFW